MLTQRDGQSAPAESLHVAQLFDVSGLMAVITGGGTGIGLMMAQALAQNGATVFIIGRRADVLERAVKENTYLKFRVLTVDLDQDTGKLVPVQGDITNSSDLQRIVAEIGTQAPEGVNLLVNNAGIARSMLPPKLVRPQNADTSDTEAPVQQLQQELFGDGPDAFIEVFSTNVISPYFVTNAFLPLLAAGNNGTYAKSRAVDSQIVAISSVHGRRTDAGISSVPYTLSKATSEHLGGIMAALLADWRIRSNTILPGLFPSELTLPVMNGADYSTRIPAGRVGTPSDIGGLVVFLASRAGAYVNGASYVLDGGWLDWSIKGRGVPA